MGWTQPHVIAGITEGVIGLFALATALWYLRKHRRWSAMSQAERWAELER